MFQLGKNIQTDFLDKIFLTLIQIKTQVTFLEQPVNNM